MWIHYEGDVETQQLALRHVLDVTDQGYKHRYGDRSYLTFSREVGEGCTSGEYFYRAAIRDLKIDSGSVTIEQAFRNVMRICSDFWPDSMGPVIEDKSLERAFFVQTVGACRSLLCMEAETEHPYLFQANFDLEGVMLK